MWQFMQKGISKYMWRDGISKSLISKIFTVCNIRFNINQTMLSTMTNNKMYTSYCLNSIDNNIKSNSYHRDKLNEFLYIVPAKFHTQSLKLKNNVSKIDTSKVPVLNEKDLEETFLRGSGPGGQAVAKTSNKCCLRHIPTGIIIHCHQTRSLQQNRKIARELLIEKLDDFYNGDQSVRAQKDKIDASKRIKRKQKSKKNANLKQAWKERQEKDQED